MGWLLQVNFLVFFGGSLLDSWADELLQGGTQSSLEIIVFLDDLFVEVQLQCIFLVSASSEDSLQLFNHCPQQDKHI